MPDKSIGENRYLRLARDVKHTAMFYNLLSVSGGYYEMLYLW